MSIFSVLKSYHMTPNSNINLLDGIYLSSYVLASRLICGQNDHPLGQNARLWGNLPLTAMKFKLVRDLHDLLAIEIKASLI